MNLERTIIALIIVLVCIFPILILKLRSGLKKTKFVKLLVKLAQDHNTSIGQYDHWNNSIIGLNKNGTKVFTVILDQGFTRNEVITLALFKNCDLVNDTAGPASIEGHLNRSNNVQLKLEGKDGHAKRINFYNIDKDGPLLSDELELAKKWCEILNKCIEQRAWLYVEPSK